MSVIARLANLTEALALRMDGSRLLAGGADLYPAVGAILRGDFIDLSTLAKLHGFNHDDGLGIGACTSWKNRRSNRLWRVLFAAAPVIAQSSAPSVRPIPPSSSRF